jgi:hypothetical protein
VFGGLLSTAAAADSVQGFECPEIFPFDRNIIPYVELLPCEVSSSLTDTDESGASKKKEYSVEKTTHSASLPSCGKDQLQNSKRRKDLK